MSEEIEERKWTLKDHLKRHKVAYTVSIVAGITLLIMRGRYAALQRGPEDLNRSNVLPLLERGVDTPLSIFSPIIGDNNTTKNIISVVEREGRGHPGYILYDITDDRYYPSQHVAAEILGGSESALSGYLQGKLDDFCGHQFKRVRAVA